MNNSTRAAHRGGGWTSVSITQTVLLHSRIAKYYANSLSRIVSITQIVLLHSRIAEVLQATSCSQLIDNRWLLYWFIEYLTSCSSWFAADAAMLRSDDECTHD